MSRATVVILLLVSLSLTITTAESGNQANSFHPVSWWDNTHTNNIGADWARNTFNTMAEVLDSVIKSFRGVVDCFELNHKKELPLTESVVDVVKVLYRCVSQGQTSNDPCIPIEPHGQSTTRADVDIVPERPKKAKQPKKDKLSRKRAHGRPIVVSPKQQLVPIPLTTVIFDLPNMMSQIEETPHRRGTHFEQVLTSPAHPVVLPPVLTYFALWLSFVYVVALVTEAILLVSQLYSKKVAIKKDKQREDQDTVLRQDLIRAATQIQVAWRRYSKVNKARLSKDQAQIKDVVLLQRIFHTPHPEEDLSRHELQRMTKEQRNVASKIYGYEQLNSCKLREVTVPDGGNCLFAALSLFKYGSPDQHHIVREQITTWLETNAEFPMGEGLPLCLSEEGCWSDFVNEMRKDKVYGTTTCIYAAAEIYGAAIRVLNSLGDDLYVVPKSYKTYETFWISFAEKHYNPLVVDPTKGSLSVPESVPQDMKECGFCTRWFDSYHPSCPRCGTPS